MLLGYQVCTQIRVSKDRLHIDLRFEETKQNIYRSTSHFLELFFGHQFQVNCVVHFTLPLNILRGHQIQTNCVVHRANDPVKQICVNTASVCYVNETILLQENSFKIHSRSHISCSTSGKNFILINPNRNFIFQHVPVCAWSHTYIQILLLLIIGFVKLCRLFSS